MSRGVCAEAAVASSTGSLAVAHAAPAEAQAIKDKVAGAQRGA